MDYFTIVLIGIGLAMDAFAVSITSGFTLKTFKVRYAFKIAIFFGAFQAIMPVLGWLAGNSFRQYIEPWDHWIAFALLSFIGGKMIYESTKVKQTDMKFDPNKLLVLFSLSLATSIDALAVGISFSVLNLQIIGPVLIIGLVTFIFSFFGVQIGKRFGKFLGNKIEITGGVVLIGIGIKILIEHLVLQ
ncbi:MAG: manganese efflux pump [Armatimonadetes bacterium]|nr:manganese efflux pump [Armatimonadota bacterium]